MSIDIHASTGLRTTPAYFRRPAVKLDNMLAAFVDGGWDSPDMPTLAAQIESLAARIARAPASRQAQLQRVLLAVVSRHAARALLASERPGQDQPKIRGVFVLPFLRLAVTRLEALFAGECDVLILG